MYEARSRKGHRGLADYSRLEIDEKRTYPSTKIRMDRWIALSLSCRFNGQLDAIATSQPRDAHAEPFPQNQTT
jgi:hypothetical protein